MKQKNHASKESFKNFYK